MDKKTKKNLKSILAQIGKNPQVDWGLSTFIFLILSVAVIIFGIYMFSRVRKGDIFTVNEDRITNLKRINIDELNNTVFDYKKREEQFNNIKNSPINITDPAL